MRVFKDEQIYILGNSYLVKIKKSRCACDDCAFPGRVTCYLNDKGAGIPYRMCIYTPYVYFSNESIFGRNSLF